nr:uncharacterized protein LOC111424959 [Onthophagus taurus]
MWKPILLTLLIVGIAQSLSSEDRFLKKYALIKIFESCFGQEVVKDIRKELKAACAKCAASPPIKTSPLDSSSTIKPTSGTKNQINHKVNENSENAMQNAMFANQQSFPTERLHQAILAFRPNSFPQPAFRPYPGSQASYYQAFANPAQMFYAGNYQPFPTAYPAAPFNYPYNPYLDTTRMSRHIDFKSQLETLSSKMNPKVSNVTCVMQELGYLDENLEPNYDKIIKRIENLPVPKELRQDIHDGITYCQQFSQCIPEPKNTASPLSRELSKPMLFFKCYKYKKLEACVMKDVREKITNLNDDDDLDGDNSKREGKKLKLDEDDGEISSNLYDFLYGIDGEIDFSNIF